MFLIVDILLVMSCAKTCWKNLGRRSSQHLPCMCMTTTTTIDQEGMQLYHLTSYHPLAHGHPGKEDR